jgi:hypothetical protein
MVVVKSMDEVVCEAADDEPSPCKPSLRTPKLQATQR